MRQRTVIYYTAENDWYDEPQDGKRIVIVHRQPHDVHIYRDPTLASCERLGRIIDNQRWSLTVDMTDGLAIASEPNI